MKSGLWCMQMLDLFKEAAICELSRKSWKWREKKKIAYCGLKLNHQRHTYTNRWWHPFVLCFANCYYLKSLCRIKPNPLTLFSAHEVAEEGDNVPGDKRCLSFLHLLWILFTGCRDVCIYTIVHTHSDLLHASPLSDPWQWHDGWKDSGLV